ncbi:GNAT family N-acetyltransferase [Paenibacillus sp. YAF4_2]|uniref:GNAT family N-acetyltransferase n=1 Tax=Paenibacillus sp. YAF4_2 TaxID=3233085 RepID=UPI003F96F111
MSEIFVRHATSMDIPGILTIYNQGIRDRIATLEVEPKDISYMEGWFREHRGQGIGSMLLTELEETASLIGFYKIVLFTFPFNSLGQSLYRKKGYREVGIFYKQGMIDGNFVDVMAMEKIL